MSLDASPASHLLREEVMIEQPWWAEGPADHESRSGGIVSDTEVPLRLGAVYSEAEIDPEQGSTARSVIVGGVVLLTAVVLTAALAGIASRPGVDLQGLVPASRPDPATHLHVRGTTPASGTTAATPRSRPPVGGGAPATPSPSTAVGSVASGAEALRRAPGAGVAPTATTRPVGPAAASAPAAQTAEGPPRPASRRTMPAASTSFGGHGRSSAAKNPARVDAQKGHRGHSTPPRGAGRAAQGRRDGATTAPVRRSSPQAARSTPKASPVKPGRRVGPGPARPGRGPRAH